MEAIQASTGESRPVIRERRGVAWCPFCDRSRQVASTGPICEGCGVEFVDSVPVVEVPVVASEPVAEEVVVEEAAEAEEPAPTRSRRSAE